MIKKLYKYSLLMMLGVPCMASDCDFNVGHREKHVSWMDGYNITEESIFRDVDPQVTKEFELKELPKRGYQMEEEEKAMAVYAEKIAGLRTLDVIEKWEKIVSVAIDHTYQYILRAILEYMQDNVIIQTVLKTNSILNRLKKLDQKFPGISNFVTKLLFSNEL
ncbi:MAG: hypothetical protein V4544_02610 [Pseudomonadota bacterium]